MRIMSGRFGHAGAGERARVALLLLLVVAPIVAAADPVHVTLEDTPGVCHVRGEFRAPVSGDTAWAVLSDYDHIGAFVPSVVSSHVEWRHENQLLLRQHAVGSMLFVKHQIEVLLAVSEETGLGITFRDVLGKDFRSYQGSWSLAADSSGTRVVYEVEADPRAAIARVFCRSALRRTALDLLERVRAEMLRRGGTPSAGAASPEAGRATP
jgi:hypothetical protein